MKSFDPPLSIFRGKISLYIMLFFGLLALLYQIPKIHTTKEIPAEVDDSKYNPPEIERFKQLAENTTICIAYDEIYNGYMSVFIRSNQNSSGFNSALINANTEINGTSSRNYGQKGNLYSHSLYKYHRFFQAYSKKLDIFDIMLIEGRNEIILYSNSPTQLLLHKSDDSTLLQLLERLKTSHSEKILSVYNKENDLTYMASRLTSNKGHQGYLVITKFGVLK